MWDVCNFKILGINSNFILTFCFSSLALSQNNKTVEYYNTFEERENFILQIINIECNHDILTSEWTISCKFFEKSERKLKKDSNWF